MTRFVCSLWITGAFLSLGAASAPAQTADFTVGVYYYPWYYNDFHGRNYLREHLAPPQLPELGEYNDRNQATIRSHLAGCRGAGIDFWVTSWWGPNSREDVTLRTAILTSSDLGDFKIAVFYETTGRTNDFSDYSRIGPDLAYLAANLFGHPNYLRIAGKPVLFIYLTRVLSSEGTLQSTLTTMRATALAAGYQLYIIGDQVFGSPPLTPGDISLLDAATDYDVYGSMGATGYAGQGAVDAYYAAQADWKALADSAGVRFVPGVSPGFNDKGVRAGHEPLSRKLTAGDEEGSLFRQMLRGAEPLADPALGKLIMVTSWNEWHEDTQIEPVAAAPPTALDDSPTGDGYTRGLPYEGYTDLYLRILKQETAPSLNCVLQWVPYR